MGMACGGSCVMSRHHGHPIWPMRGTTSMVCPRDACLECTCAARRTRILSFTAQPRRAGDRYEHLCDPPGPAHPTTPCGRAPERRRADRPGPGRPQRGAPLPAGRIRTRARAPGSDRTPRKPGRGPGTRARSDPLRADAGLAVRLLPRRGPRDGQRPGHDAGRGPARATVRGRPPVELRGLRQPRAANGLRHQRLRRDHARAVRVGPEAAGREPRGGRPGPGLRRRGARSDRPHLREQLPHRDGRLRRADQPGGLLRAARRGGGGRPLPGQRAAQGRSSAPRRASPRRAPRTACRPSTN